MAHQPRRMLVDKQMLNSFSVLDYNIYNALLHNLGSLADLRVADIARLAGVSNATVVRFCKKCGYAGFPDLKRAALEAGREGLPTEQLPPIIRDMQATLSPVRDDDIVKSIDAAFERIRWADSIYFIGVGRSSGLALYGAHLFSDLGLPAIPLDSFLSFAGASAREGVVAIVISHGGETLEVNAGVQELMGNGGETIALTSNPRSTLARLCDVCITYPTYQDPALSAARQTSQAAALYVIEQLGRLTYNERLRQDGVPEA